MSLNLSEGWLRLHVFDLPPLTLSRPWCNLFDPCKPFFLISSAALGSEPVCCGVARQQLWSNGYQGDAEHVTLWFHKGLIDWDRRRRRRGSVMGEGGQINREMCVSVCAKFCRATRLALMWGSVYNHSDTRRLGWGWVLPMHNEKFLLGEAASQTQTQPARLSDSVCQEHPWHRATWNKRWSAN